MSTPPRHPALPFRKDMEGSDKIDASDTVINVKETNYGQNQKVKHHVSTSMCIDENPDVTHERIVTSSRKGPLSSFLKPRSLQVAAPRKPKACRHGNSSCHCSMPCSHGNVRSIDFTKVNSNDGRRKRRAHSISGPPPTSSSPPSSLSLLSSYPQDKIAPSKTNELPPSSPTMKQDMQRLQNLTIRSPVVSLKGAAAAVAPPPPRPSTMGSFSPLPAAKPSPLSGFHSPRSNSSFSPYTRSSSPSSRCTGSTACTPQQSPIVPRSRNDSGCSNSGSIGLPIASATPLRSRTPPNSTLARSSPRQVPLKILSNNQTPSLTATSASSSATKSPHFSRLLPPHKDMSDSPLLLSIDRMEDDSDDEDDALLFSPGSGSNEGHHRAGEERSRGVPHFVSISSIASSTSISTDDHKPSHVDNGNRNPPSSHKNMLASPSAFASDAQRRSGAPLRPFGQGGKFKLSPRTELGQPPKSVAAPNAAAARSFPIVTPSPRSSLFPRPRNELPSQPQDSSSATKPIPERASTSMPPPPRPAVPETMIPASLFASTTDHDEKVGDEMNGLLQGFLNHKRQNERKLEEPSSHHQNLNRMVSQDRDLAKNRDSYNSLAFSIDSHQTENAASQFSYPASSEIGVLMPLQRKSSGNILDDDRKDSISEELNVFSCDQAPRPCPNTGKGNTVRPSGRENIPLPGFSAGSEYATDFSSHRLSLGTNKKNSRKSHARASLPTQQQRKRREGQVFSSEGIHHASVPSIKAKSLFMPSSSESSLRALFTAEAIADAANLGTLSDSDDEDNFVLHAPDDICLDASMGAASSTHSIERRENEEEEVELARMPKQRRRNHQTDNGAMTAIGKNSKTGESSYNKSDKVGSNTAFSINLNDVDRSRRNSADNRLPGSNHTSSSSSSSYSSIEQSKLPNANGTIAATRQQLRSVKFSSTPEDHLHNNGQMRFSRSSFSRISSSSLFGMDILHEESQTIVPTRSLKESSGSLSSEDKKLSQLGSSSSGSLYRGSSEHSLGSLGLCIDSSSHNTDHKCHEQSRDLITPPIQATHPTAMSELSPPPLNSEGPTTLMTIVGLEHEVDGAIPETSADIAPRFNYAKNCSVTCAIANMERGHGTDVI